MHTLRHPSLEDLTSTLDLDALTPDTPVLVAPLYLAGPGSRAPVLDVLDDAPGWTQTVPFDNRDTYFTSPCQRVRIANTADSYFGGWTITYAEDPLGVPDWITTFDRNTPQEIVAGFASALVDSLPSNFRDYFSDGPHYTGDSHESVFRRHSWELVRGSRPYWNISPDGHAGVRTRSGWTHEYDELVSPAKSMWRLSAGVEPRLTPSWRAYLTRTTLPHLRAAAANVITSTDAVVRRVEEIPELHRDLVHVRVPGTQPTTPLSQMALARSPHTAQAHTPATAPTPTKPAPQHGRSRRQR
ncbi:DUF317 domain-containing protein [Streptomyces mayonensis]|uniref:DUF317 domain-containing protein n=1 Tax=Streptomyces mayonensis TaxID=2750816 RepID=UPI001C1DFBA0|nr:DUF317 domain-containing protein [Streptomyces sp. A108]MBU6529689.1 DUF317 domain-containing protein [Streptomyces sp. A108]